MSGMIRREAASFAQLSFGDGEDFGNRMGAVEIIGIEEKTGAGDNKSEGVRVGKGIKDMDGLVCEPTSEVVIIVNESMGGSGI